MINLQGRLLALDPSATETLKIISYFDSLAQAHAGVEAIVRGATALGGCAAGVTDGTPDGTLRVSAAGIPTRGQLLSDGDWPTKTIEGRPKSFVWIERIGAAQVNDEMVLERFALSVSIAQYRTDASVRPSAMELLIDKRATEDERQLAAAHLHLEPGRMERIVATPASSVGTWPKLSTIIWTEAGIVRASLCSAELPQRAGVGLLTPLLRLPTSWASALSALQLTDSVEPVLWADKIGSLLMLADQIPIGPDPHQVEKVIAEHRWAAETMAALSRHSSVRKAAEVLGVHHSTLQARIVTLNRGLEFDIVPQTGRIRMTLAFAVYRFTHPNF